MFSKVLAGGHQNISNKLLNSKGKSEAVVIGIKYWPQVTKLEPVE